MDYKIQSPGDYQHPGLNLPVRYTEEFLETLAGTGDFIVEEEHKGPTLAEFQNVFFKDGVLQIKVDSELETKNKGFSPIIKADLLFKGDHYEPVNGVLQKRIALTRDPKDTSTILYNSNIQEPGDPPGNNNNGVGSLGDNETIGQLKEKIGSLKTQLNDKIDEVNTLKTNIKDVETERDDFKTKLGDKEGELNTINTAKQQEVETLAKELAGDDEDLLEAYKKLDKTALITLQKKSTKDLAKELAGDDEDLLKIYEDMPKQTLITLKEKKTPPDSGHQGVGATEGEDQNNGGEGEGSENKDKPESYEEYTARTSGW